MTLAPNSAAAQRRIGLFLSLNIHQEKPQGDESDFSNCGLQLRSYRPRRWGETVPDWRKRRSGEKDGENCGLGDRIKDNFPDV